MGGWWILLFREKTGELSSGLCKPARRFVAEALYGIQARQSVLLSVTGRALNETIRLKKTETRLSNKLGRASLEDHLLENLLRKGSGRIKADTLLVLDPSDIAKPYAWGMEYLTHLRDGSTGENTEIIRAVDMVSRHTETRGTWVVDRGGDRRKLYEPSLGHKLRFVIRLVGSRHLECGRRLVLAREIALRCPMLYADQVVREKDGKEPLMLLTNVEVKRSRRSCSFILDSYLRRWQTEDTIRCMKQSYDLENVRLLSYLLLQNMMVSAFAT